MKLSRAGDYVLHALAYLAAQKQDSVVPSHVIAKDEGIPEKFLLKMLNLLVSTQILRSLKGPNGGFRLTQPARAITVLEVVEAIDGPIRGEAPFESTSKEGGVLDAKLAEVCQQVADLVRERLGKVPLSELVKK